VRSHRASARELERLAPAINRRTILDAIYLPEGGVAPHQAAMHAYLEAAQEQGVRTRYGCPVIGIERRGTRAEGVRGADFVIACDTLVIAAGPGSNALAGSLGVGIEARATRIEAMALEPTRPFLRPAVAFIDRLCYLSQTARGEIVGGTEVAETPRETLSSDLPSIAANARVYCEMLPALSRLRILRQWSGFLHIAPDCGPLIGPLPGLSNAWASCGWCYGYAGAPAVGELLARSILSGSVDAHLAPFALDRFANGRPVQEAGIVVATPSHTA
jgi:sarcosine oxidase subunit beta